MTDAVALATAVVLLATALIGVWTELRKVHKLVNSKMSEALERIEQLTSALVGSDTPVPDDPNA